MRSVKSVVVAGLAALLSTAAFAADVPIAPPPPPYGYAPPPGYGPPQVIAPASDEFVGWYLRGDIGVTNQKVKTLFNVLYETPGTSVQTVGAGFGGSALFGVGVGYQFGSWLRADITGEYRAKASIHGLDIVRFNGVPVGTDQYGGSKEEWLALVNLYADLGTWWCITPFIGVGIGGARTTISSFTDINTPTNGVAFAHDESKFDVRLRAACRSRLQGLEQPDHGTGLPLRQSRRRDVRRPAHLHRHQQRQQPDALPRGLVARHQARRALDLLRARSARRPAAGADAPRLIANRYRRRRRGHNPRRFL